MCKWHDKVEECYGNTVQMVE